MGIETWNLKWETNPAWKAVECLRYHLVSKFNLHPNTVKPFFSPEQIISSTALAGILPKTEIHWEKLTRFEQSLLREPNSEITKIGTMGIVDIDGIFNNVFSPVDWANSPVLATISQRFQRMIICSHRAQIDEDGLFWRQLTKIFHNDPRLSSRFPFLSVQKAMEIEEKLTSEKTRIIHGSKWFNNQTTKKIFGEIDFFNQSFEDPYLVYIGSSLPDIFLFLRIINYLRKKERPFDRVVFCTNGHLLQ